MLRREAAQIGTGFEPACPDVAAEPPFPGRLRAWLMAGRPRTLTIALVPVVAGSATAWSASGRFDPLIALAALVAAVLIQVGTNLHNDVADAARGADDPATRLGPPRATAHGWLSPSAVRLGAAAAFGLAVAVGGWLVALGGWPILVAGLASIAAGVAYTGGPRPLGYSALGELFVWIFFGLVAVGGTHYLQAGTLGLEALLAGALLGLPAAAVLVVNNYRDIEGDARAGKRTLAVRIGARATRIEYAVLVLAPVPLLPLVDPAGATPGWAFLPWLAAPWGVSLAWRLWREPPGAWLNGLLAATAHYQLALGALLAAGLVLGSPGTGGS